MWYICLTTFVFLYQTIQRVNTTTTTTPRPIEKRLTIYRFEFCRKSILYTFFFKSRNRSLSYKYSDQNLVITLSSDIRVEIRKNDRWLRISFPILDDSFKNGRRNIAIYISIWYHVISVHISVHHFNLKAFTMGSTLNAKWCGKSQCFVLKHFPFGTILPLHIKNRLEYN